MIRKHNFIFLTFLLCTFYSYDVLIGQDCNVEGTIFINEIGNFGYNDEYVELVVVGSSSNPTAPVNLEDFIIDDNDYADNDIGNQPGCNNSNYEIGDISDATPGFPNNPANQLLIERIKSGSFSCMLQIHSTIKSQPTHLSNRDGVIEVNISGGSPPYLLTLQGKTYRHIVQKRFEHAGTYLIDALPTNEYEIEIGDSSPNICGKSIEVFLTKATAVCRGDCTEIGDTTGSMYGYFWPGTGASTPTQTVCPIETTTYTLTSIDENGNKIETNYTVEVKSAKINPNPTLICPGISTVDLNCIGTFPSYQWSNGAKTPSITITSADNYKVRVVDENNCVLEGIAKVYDTNNPEDIKKFFIERGFKQNTDVVIQDFPGIPGKERTAEKFSPCFNNLANSLLESTTLHREIDYDAEFKFFCKSGNYQKVYITENENFSSEHMQALADFNLGDGTVMWFHLFRSGSESILFFSDNL